MKTTPVLNAKIGGTNFSGFDLTGRNVKKTRSFMLFIDDPELLERWGEDKVKIYKGRSGRCFTIVNLPDNDEKCQIKIKFRGEEPEILDPLMYPLLDICKISRAELTINEYHWSVYGRSGVKLYLANGTFTINKRVNACDVFAFFDRRKKAINNYGDFTIKDINADKMSRILQTDIERTNNG